MNARDKIYTGKVEDWGLPDGTGVDCIIRYIGFTLNGEIVGDDFKAEHG